jgi:ubiquinone/menaquinone biosynthesis C-methylase UbiE
MPAKPWLRLHAFVQEGERMTESFDISSDSSDYQGYVIDAENAAEMARLMLQDRLLTKTMGGVLAEQSDLSHVYRVLDIGCGPGGWLLDVTTQYPHIHGVGIDISQLMIAYATSVVKSEKRANVQFRVMDITEPLNFPENTFDLVNGRLLTGVLTTARWPTLLQECLRITRPGGILRFTEAEWGFTNSAAFDTLQGKLGSLALYRAGHSFSPNARTVGTTNMLRLLLQQAGCQQINYHAHALDYSFGTEGYESNVHNMLVFHKLYQPFLVRMQVASQKELQRLYEQMEKEVQSKDFCAIDYFLTVWGRKSK